MTRRIHLIAAARPNFMKVAPLYHALKAETAWATPVLVHTGQHYDVNMSANFFRDLKLPAPDHNLEIGSGSHAEQTAGVMVAYEKLCRQDPPDLVVVVGDVNSTVACTLAAKKLNLRVAHLEAGLRSGDMTMPEEVNRIVTDSISDYLWTPSPDGDENLRREGKRPEQIVRVGNIMMDCYEMLRAAIEAEPGPAAHGLTPGKYTLVTLHRPSNVDTASALGALVEALIGIARRMPLVFPVHPRTRKQLETFGFAARLGEVGAIRLTEPLSYIPFMAMVRQAACVITDSGGVQEETTYLDIPCLTLRDTTERPVTISEGSNRLVRVGELEAAVDEVAAGRWPHGRKPALWDGATASRIVAHIRQCLQA